MKNANQQDSVFPNLQWRWCQLTKMKPLLLYDMLALREAIFVVEQACIYQELDGLDKIAEHLLVTQNESVVACLRLLPPAGREARVRVGRVAVSAAWRQRGMARSMMQMAINKARRSYPSAEIFLNAQTYLQEFYKSLGFRLCGDEFLEDGIPHVPMQIQSQSQR
jgi:ElaA protein